MGLLCFVPKAILFLILTGYFLLWAVHIFHSDIVPAKNTWIYYLVISHGLNMHRNIPIADYLPANTIGQNRIMIARVWGYLTLTALALFKFGRYCWLRALAKTVLVATALLFAIFASYELFKYAGYTLDLAMACRSEVVTPIMIAGMVLLI